MKLQSYRDAIAWLESHINYERALDRANYDSRSFEIDSFREALAKLDDPHYCAPAIHIAGSRGKGTTAQFLEALLRARGLRTALYTSPHFEDYTERIRIDGSPISESEFAELLSEARAIHTPNNASQKSFKTVFEILTAMFFLAARRHRVDWMIVETGLGGRLDSTNVLPPGPVVLTRIGLEHTHLLGNTITAISSEKAAILKPGGFGVYSKQAPGGEAESVFMNHAQSVAAPLESSAKIVPLESEVYTPDGMKLVYRLSGERLELELPIFGTFIAENLQSTLAMLGRLEESGRIPTLTHGELTANLRDLRFRGRMQCTLMAAKSHPEVWIDAAHCPAGARALVESLHAHFGDDPICVIVAMARDKDHAGFFREIAQHPHATVLLAPLEGPRGASCETLMAAANEPLGALQSYPNLLSALNFAIEAAEDYTRVVVTGSNFSVATVERWSEEIA